MAGQDYVYISGDSHLEIDTKYWRDRVPALHRDRVPRVIKLPDGGDAWIAENSPLTENPFDLYGGKGRENWWPFGQSYDTTKGTGPAEQRIREQDEDGIAAEVLFPGVVATRLWRNIRDDDAYLALIHAYNDFLAEDYCAVNRDRLIGLGIMPATGADDMIAEMERCAKMGLKAVVISTFPSGAACPTKDDDRFWAAAVDMNMPVTIHQELKRPAGTLLYYPPEAKRLRARLGDYAELCVQVTKYAQTGGINACQLLLSGVFDRFPGLDLFFAETQIGWLPFAMAMADVRFERHRLWTERLFEWWQPPKELPSYYLGQRCYWGFQYDRVGVENRHRISVEHCVWATDFPHQESEWPNSMGIVERNFAGVPEDEVRKMVQDNVVRFFHLDLDSIAKQAPCKRQPAAV
ncbi:MAG TPA: amidohydrolase family protein [Chloroflexota bacterium]|nr:amidohydrolase family protein [Chloroflexota bacterium]